MSEQVLKTTDATFDENVLASERPVLVDFYADWCGPCRAVAPTVESLADDFAGRVDVRKVDIDLDPGLASRYGIRGIPTLLVFKDGEVVGSIVGVRPKQVISELLEAHIR